MHFSTLQPSTQNTEGFKRVTAQWKKNNGAEIFKNKREEGDNPHLCIYEENTNLLV